MQLHFDHPFLWREIPLPDPVTPKRDWSTVAVALVLLALTGLAVGGTAALGDTRVALRLLALIIGAFVAALLLHELGHFLLALSQGLRHRAFAFWFRALVQRNGRSWWDRIDHPGTMGMFGWLGLIVPPEQLRAGGPGLRKYALVLLAGPLFNLAAAGIVWALLPPQIQDGSWAQFGSYFRWLSIGYGLIHLTPLGNSQKRQSDGVLAWRMLRRDEVLRRRLEIAAYADSSLQPGLWEPLVYSAPLPESATTEAELQVYQAALYSAMDRGDEPAASDAMEQILRLSHAVPWERGDRKLEAAFFCGYILREPQLAEQWLQDAMNEPVMGHGRNRRRLWQCSEALMLALQGDLEQAIMKIRVVRTLGWEYPYSYAYHQAIDSWLAMIEQELSEELAGTVPR